MRPTLFREKRKSARIFLDLPLEFRIRDVPDAFGGIVVDGSEGGLLIQSRRELPLGAKLSMSVLFPNGFELANFQAVGQILRKIPLTKGEQGHRYGLRIIMIEPRDRVKLRYTLSGLHDLGVGEAVFAQAKV